MPPLYVLQETMKRILSLCFLTAVLPFSLFGYSGDDLTGMNELVQIAQWLQIYAHDHDGKVPVPYADVPGVARSIEELAQTRGTLVLGDHENFSMSDPVPIGFYTIGGVVITGFSDGSTRYYEYTDRPPWVVLREGPTFGQWVMIISPVLNVMLLAMIVLMWRPRQK